MFDMIFYMKFPSGNVTYWLDLIIQIQRGLTQMNNEISQFINVKNHS